MGPSLQLVTFFPAHIQHLCYRWWTARQLALSTFEHCQEGAMNDHWSHEAGDRTREIIPLVVLVILSQKTRVLMLFLSHLFSCSAIFTVVITSTGSFTLVKWRAKNQRENTEGIVFSWLLSMAVKDTMTKTIYTRKPFIEDLLTVLVAHYHDRGAQWQEAAWRSSWATSWCAGSRERERLCLAWTLKLQSQLPLMHCL